MSCRIPHDKLRSLFIKSLSYDRPTYRFYRNYIKSIMNMPIMDEAKVHAIWFGGLSYNDALNYEADIVTEGLPAAISNLVLDGLSDPNADFSELLNGIRDILGEEVKAGKPATSVSDIEAKKAEIERRRNEHLDLITDNNGGNAFVDAFDTQFDKRDQYEYFSGKTRKEVEDKVNAKYDAELAALGGAAPTEKKTLKAKYIGKIIYATPGAGKTTISQMIPDIVDTDQMMIDEMRSRHPDFTMEPGESPQQFIYRYVKTHDHKPSINETVFNKARELAENGKTVVTGTMAFIKDVDVVVIVPAANPRVQSRFGSAQIAAEFGQREAEEVQKHGKKATVIQTNLENLLLESMTDVLPGKTSVELINDLLAQFKKSDISFIYNALQQLDSIIDTSPDLSLQSKIDAWTKFKEILAVKPDSTSKTTAQISVSARLEELQPALIPSGFIDIGRIPGLGSDIYIIRKGINGDIIQTIRIADRYYVITDLFDGSNPEVLEEYIIQPLDQVQEMYSQKVNLSISDNRGGYRRTTKDFINNGIGFADTRLYPEGAVKGKDLDNRPGHQRIADDLKPGLSVLDQVKIVADRRRRNIHKKRINFLRSRGYAIDFENDLHPNQVNYLLSGTGRPVLSFLKLKSGFDIIISDQDGINWDYLQSFDSLGFVFPDGTTRLVNWDSAEDLALIQQTLRYKKYTTEYTEGTKQLYEYVNVTAAEVESIRQSVLKLREMKAEIEELMTEDVMEVPREILTKYYNIANVFTYLPLPELQGESKVYTPTITLNEAAAQLITGGSTVKATIVKKVSGRLQPETAEETDVVGVIYRNPDTGTISFFPSVKEGYVIVDNNMNEIKDPYKTLFEGQGLNMDDLFAQLGEGQNIQNRYFYLVRMDEAFRVRPMQQFAPMTRIEDLVNFMSTLSALTENRPVFNPDNKNELVKLIQEFNNQGWGFNMAYGISPNIDYLRMWEHMGEREPVFGIKFRAQPGYPHFDEFNDQDLRVEFNFNYLDVQKHLTTLYNELGIDPTQYKTVAERIELGRLLASKLKNATELNLLSKNAKYALQSLTDDYKRTRDGIYKQLNKIISKHTKDVAAGKPRYIESADNLIYSVFANVNGTGLKIRSRYQSENLLEQFKIFEKNLEDGSSKQLKVISVNPRVSTGSTIKVPGPVSTGASTASTTPVSPTSKPKIGGKRAFSLIDGLTGLTQVSDKELAAEAADVKRVLGSTLQGLVPKDLSEEDVTGRALAYVEDRFIYFDSKLKVGGVLYHEAFHIVFRAAFTEAQRNYYLNVVEKMHGGIKSDKDGKYIKIESKKVYLNKFRLDRRYSGVSDETIAAYIYEEYMADGYRDFKLEGKRSKNALINLFYNVISKITDFFKGKAYRQGKKTLRKLYQDIDNGKYADIVGDPYKAPRAYELSVIPTSIDTIGSEVIIRSSPIDSQTNNQLVDRITYELLKRAGDIDKSNNETFDKVYDEVTADLIGYFNIDRFIERSDPNYQAASDKYEPTFRAMRFMMGAVHRPEFGESFALFNKTGNSAYDNYLFNDADGAAEASLSTYTEVKAEVKKRYDTIGIIEDQLSGEEDEVNRANSEDNQDEEYQESNDESNVGERYDDDGITSIKPYDGSREFQKLIRFVKYEYVDPELGVTFERMVDSRNVINIIRKLTVNVPKAEIIPTLVSNINNLDYRINAIKQSGILDNLNYVPESYKNLVDLYNTLSAVYFTIDEQAGLTESYVATREKGLPFYNMFHDVFYYAQKNVIAVNIDTDFETVNPDAKTDEGFPIVNRYRVENLIQKHDINIVLEKFTTDIDLMRGNLDSLPITVEELIDEVKTFNYETPTDAASFRNVVAGIYRLFLLGKIDIPFNVIEFSVAADVKKKYKDQSTFVDDIIRPNRSFYNDGNYLNIDVFLKGYERLLSGLNKVNIEQKIAALKMEYRKVTPFQVKYEPGLTGTTVLNQDGKPISQFVPYVPSIQILSQIQSKGLTKAIEDIYGSTTWFADNPWLNVVLSNTRFDPEKTSSDKKALAEDTIRVFLKNMDISIAGGLYQDYRGAERKSTYRRLGERGYTLSVLGLFANRSVIKGNYNQSIEIFNRPITQLEATSTQFNVSGLYYNYNQKDADKTIVNRFKSIIKQEYNRIKREWATRNDPTKKLYAGYNSVTLPNGDVITDDTTLDTKLRAYTFNYLADFFDANGTTNILKGLLINGAKDGLTFEEVLDANPEQLTDLDNELISYGERTVKEFENYLESIGITYDDLPSAVRVGTETRALTEYQEVIDDATGESRSYQVRAEEATDKNKKAFVRDFTYNYWFNSFYINQLFDGDLALGIKNFIDYFKRQKSGVAAGNNQQNVNILESEDYITAAVFRSFDGYLSKDPVVPVTTEDNGGDPIKIADGQGYTTIQYRINKLTKSGLASPKVLELLKKMRYAALTDEEISYLRDNDVVLNSDKPVVAHPMFYFKLSEHYINRTDVSIVSDPQAVAELYKRLDAIDFSNPNIDANPMEEYQRIIRRIHSYFTPMPGRQFQFNLLNAMEYHRIDLVIDEESTKKVAPSPLVVNAALLDDGILTGHPVMRRPGSEGIESVKDGYINLAYSRVTVPNAFVYEQVKTGGISSESTDAIQKKLLLPAQLDPKQFPLVNSIARVQNDIANARLEYLMRMFKTNTPAALVTKAINSGLLSQGAGSNLLKYYSLNDEGKNKFNLNLPILGKTPLYYFFSIWNNNLFGPKIAGKKFYHVSTLGYKIVVDENDVPVPRELVAANPRFYANYATRYPSVREVKNADGEVIKVVVEIIVPREVASTPEEKAFFEQLYRDFIITRIPTEDKRSMAVVEIVDTIDATYGNTIIVPSQVHKWAGSDMDIDSVYADVYDFYTNNRGDMIKYGNYDLYQRLYGLSVDEAKFVEYIHFVAQDPSMKNLIDGEIEKQVNVLGHRLLSIQNMAGDFGPKLSAFFQDTPSPELTRLRLQEEINNLELTQTEYLQENILLKSQIEYLNGLISREQIKYTDARGIERTTYAPVDNQINEEKRILRAQISRNEVEIRTLDIRIESINNLIENRYKWEDIKKSYDLNTMMTRLVTSINVLKSLELPSTVQEFKEFSQKHGNPVMPTLQNEILDYKKALLSDPRVYERFVKNAEAEVYISAYKNDKRIVEPISEFKGVNKSNPFTFQTVATARALNSGSKDMLGANASQNKAAALMVSSKVKLKPEYTHKFKYNGKTIKTNLPVDNAVQLVGGAIGVAADDQKHQLLAYLRLSRINAGVVNALYMYGYPPQFARLLSSVDLIADTIKNYRLNDDPSYSRSGPFKVGFGKAIKNNLSAIVNNSQINKELTNYGILKADPNNPNQYTIDLSKVTIEFKDVAADAVISNLQPSSFNITVRNDKGEVITNQYASIVLLAFYDSMFEVGNAMSFKVATVTNVYKQIRPDFESLSKIRDAAKWSKQKDNPIFENLNKIFKDNPGLDTLVTDGIDAMTDKSKQVLLDQTDLFSAITSLFKYDRNISKEEVVTQLKSILAFSALNKYIEKRMPEIDEEDLSTEDTFLLMMAEALTPEYWIKNTVSNDLEYLKSLYPNNLFLRSLTEKPAMYSRVRGQASAVRVVTSMIGNKVTDESRDAIIDDFYQLLNSDDISVYNAAMKIAIHAIVKDGGISRRESFLKLLAPELFTYLSRRLDEVQEGLYKVDTTSKRKLDTYLAGLDGLFRDLYNLPKDSKSAVGTDSQRVLMSILNKLVTTLTINSETDPGIRMSFFPGNERFSKGKFADMHMSIFTRIIDRIVPKNKDLVYERTTKGVRPATYGPRLTEATPSKTRYELWKGDENGELFFDLTNLPQEYNTQALRILKAQGIFPVHDKGKYSFPLYKINSYDNGQLFVLQEIDGKPFNQEFFANLFDAYSKNEEFEYLLRGKTAKYKIVNRQGVDRISPNAFTNKNAVELTNYVAGERSVTSEPVAYVPTLPREARVLSNSSYVVVNNEELANSLLSGSYMYEGRVLNLGSTKIKYSTNAGGSFKDVLFIDGRIRADENQKNQFANRLGYATYEEALANPRLNAWLNPTTGRNQMYLIPYTEESGGTTNVVDIDRPTPAPSQPAITLSEQVPPSIPGVAQTGEQIYAQLGDKTQSENVEIPGKGDLKDVKYDPKTFWSEVVPEARAWYGDKLIIAYRGKKTNTFLQNYKGRLSGEPAATIGNPFDFADEKGTREEQGIKSTKKFIEWMITGNNFGNINATEEYRQAIIEDIKNGKLKGRPIIYYQEKRYATHATALDYLINKYDWSKPTTPTATTAVTPTTLTQPQAPVSTGFQGYKGGFEDKGKGTPQGDGKDKAMREAADGAILEFKTDKVGSSTLTTLEKFEGSYSYEKDRYVGTAFLGDDFKGYRNKVIMLARNGKLKGTNLDQSTKYYIKKFHNLGVEFVVGDMPGVDSQFIDYLQEIGAKFTIYHTGPEGSSRIKVSQPVVTPTQPTAPVTVTTSASQLSNNTLESDIEDAITNKLKEKVFKIGEVAFEKIELKDVNVYVKKESNNQFSIAIDNKGQNIFRLVTAVMDFQKRDINSNSIYVPNPGGFILWDTFLKSEVAKMSKSKIIIDNRFSIALGALKALKNNGIEFIHFPERFYDNFKTEYSQFLKQEFSSVGYTDTEDIRLKTIQISIDDLARVIKLKKEADSQSTNDWQNVDNTSDNPFEC